MGLFIPTISMAYSHYVFNILAVFTLGIAFGMTLKKGRDF